MNKTEYYSNKINQYVFISVDNIFQKSKIYHQEEKLDKIHFLSNILQEIKTLLNNIELVNSHYKYELLNNNKLNITHYIKYLDKNNENFQLSNLHLMKNLTYNHYSEEEDINGSDYMHRDSDSENELHNQPWINGDDIFNSIITNNSDENYDSDDEQGDVINQSDNDEQGDVINQSDNDEQGDVINQSDNEATNQSDNEATNQSDNEAINQSDNEATNQSDNEATNQSDNEATNQSDNDEQGDDISNNNRFEELIDLNDNICLARVKRFRMLATKSTPNYFYRDENNYVFGKQCISKKCQINGKQQALCLKHSKKITENRQSISFVYEEPHDLNKYTKIISPDDTKKKKPKQHKQDNKETSKNIEDNTLVLNPEKTMSRSTTVEIQKITYRSKEYFYNSDNGYLYDINTRCIVGMYVDNEFTLEEE